MKGILRHEKVSAPEAFRLDHDELRAQLVSATMEPGPIGEAAKRLARLCVSHFEQEERHVHPIFEYFHRLAMDDVQPDMEAILPLVSRFSMRQIQFHAHHEMIASAIAEVLAIARKDGNRRIAELAFRLSLHERMEDALVYPAAILIGNYVRDRLGLSPGTNEQPAFLGRESVALS